MPGDAEPRVTVGLPVYNGERYLGAALESLLAQTYPAFELLVVDNASTDGTGQIARSFAERDQRVRYVRNDTNIGIARNFNRCVELARGELLKWAAHDDLQEPQYLTRCVEALDADSSLVGSCTQAVDIDQSGRRIRSWPSRPDLRSPRPHRRFFDMINKQNDTFPLFGVIRLSALRRTRLMGRYPGGDRTLLAELALLGRFEEVPEALFLHREHPERSTLARGSSVFAAPAWDPDRAGRVNFVHWRALAELVRAVRLAGLDRGERVRCYAAVVRWAQQGYLWLKLGYDVAVPLRPVLNRLWRLRGGNVPA